ncbi:MAG: DoxX family protein [Patescibacteria group bacterium]
MLNTFPSLLTFSLLAPLILRVVLGLIFINLGYLELTVEKKRWTKFFETVHLKPAKMFVIIMGLAEIIGGFFLLTGFMTQIVALVFSIITFGEFYAEYREETLLKRDLIFYLLIFAISLSLLLSGAGLFAIDYPL